MLKKELQICENLGWNVSDLGEEIELEKYSNLGEDFVFAVDKENFAENVANYAENCFDAEEHATMWYDSGDSSAPNSLRDLLDDADEIQKDLTALAEALKGEK